MKKIFIFVLAHKLVSLIILGVIVGGGYFIYQKVQPQQNQITYSTQTIEKGMLISSVSGSGQVSALNQVDIKSKVSGDLVLLEVQNGQQIKQNDLIAQIDSRQAINSVNDAKASLENAKLELEELLKPTDAYTLMQAENAIADAETSLIKLKTTQVNNYQDAQQDKLKTEEDLVNAYEDAYGDIDEIFLDLPDIISSLDDVLYSNEISNDESTLSRNSNNNILINAIPDSEQKSRFERYVYISEDTYQTTDDFYDEIFTDYKKANRYSDSQTIENLLKDTIELIKKISDTIKTQSNMLDYWVEYRNANDFSVYSQINTYQTTLVSYIIQTNNYLSSLSSTQNQIETYQENIIQAQRDLKEMEQNQPLDLAQSERSLQEKKEKLADLEAGASELEIKNKQLSVQQKQNSLIEAQQNLADYYIRAPFDGLITEVDVTKGDSLGSSSVIASLITNQKIAIITLNEIDVAQIKVGQKAALSFDALSDLSITGQVAEVNTLGTVNSGVVSYDVKIAFDVQDDRVKPGMSVSVNIIVESKADVLLVPISAVKTQGTQSYVEILVDGVLQKKNISTGSSNDIMIEVTDGLEEGDEVISQTTTTTTNSSSNNSRSDGPPSGMMRMF